MLKPRKLQPFLKRFDLRQKINNGGKCSLNIHPRVAHPISAARRTFRTSHGASHTSHSRDSFATFKGYARPTITQGKECMAAALLRYNFSAWSKLHTGQGDLDRSSSTEASSSQVVVSHPAIRGPIVLRGGTTIFQQHPTLGKYEKKNLTRGLKKSGLEIWWASRRHGTLQYRDTSSSD